MSLHTKGRGIWGDPPKSAHLTRPLRPAFSSIRVAPFSSALSAEKPVPRPLSSQRLSWVFSPSPHTHLWGSHLSSPPSSPAFPPPS